MDHRDELGSAILRSKPARSQVLTSLDLNAVHNQSATATARTQAGDRQSRKVAIDPRILLTDRLRDEHGRHSGASYYRPAGLLTFFFDLLRLADAGGIAYGIELVFPSERDGATASLVPPGPFSQPTLLVTSTLSGLTAVHELVHVNNFLKDWPTGSGFEAKRADEALA